MSTIKPRLSEPARRARDLAHARSQRAARMSRRDAARNRRVMYQVVLGLLTVAAWALVSYAGWHLTAVIVPAVLLVAVVALSVRAAGERRTLNSGDRAEIRRIDGELRALSRRPRERELAAGAEAAAEPGAADATAQIAAGEAGGQTASRTDDVAARTWATVSSDRLTSGVSDAAGTGADRQERLVPEHDGAEGTGRGDAPARTAQDESGWTPVPVPASRWAGDGSDAPRRTAPAFEAPAAPSARVPLRPTRPSSMSSSVVAGSGADAPEPGAPRASVLDLDAALARRRAKGA